MKLGNWWVITSHKRLWMPSIINTLLSWWRHQMETFSALLAICAGNSPVSGEFPAQMPVTRSFDVFFDLHPNKRLIKQWWGWWFETPSCPLWRHRNARVCCVSTRLLVNTVQCHYNAVIFFSKTFTKKSTIARPWGRGMGFLLGFRLWLIFCLRSCNDVCNTMLYWTAL